MHLAFITIYPAEKSLKNKVILVSTYNSDATRAMYINVKYVVEVHSIETLTESIVLVKSDVDYTICVSVSLNKRPENKPCTWHKAIR